MIRGARDEVRFSKRGGSLRGEAKGELICTEFDHKRGSKQIFLKGGQIHPFPSKKYL